MKVMEWPSVKARQTALDTADSAKKVRNEIYLQGKLLIVKQYHYSPGEQKLRYRKAITEFSKGSRWNLLKQIARIDWSKIPQGLFVTLTFPDSVACSDIKTATMHRHHWIRDMENYLCEETPILWRKEHKVRKSGEHKGMYVAHFHLCVFTRKHLPHTLVRDWWRKTLHVDGPLATDVKRMSSGEHAAFYLAKYLTKKETDASLDYAAYLTKPGRAWGFHRPKLIPFHPLDPIIGLTFDQYDEVIAIARKYSKQRHPSAWSSFTLIGDRALAAKAEILEKLS